MKALDSAIVMNNIVHLPIQLSPKEWAKFSRAMKTAGGIWSKSKQAFTFERNAHALISRLKELGTRAFNKHHLYETPDEILEFIHDWSMNQFTPSGDVIRVLEPSIGGGALLTPVLAFLSEAYPNHTVEVTAFDIDPINVALCQQRGWPVTQGDFLKQSPNPVYDLVIQNPPYNGREYQRHIAHGQKFLNESGIMIAIAPIKHALNALRDRQSATQSDIWLYEEAAKNSTDFINEAFDKNAFKGACIETGAFILRHQDYDMPEAEQAWAIELTELALQNIFELSKTLAGQTHQKWEAFLSTPTQAAEDEFLNSFLSSLSFSIGRFGLCTNAILKPTECAKSEIARIMNHSGEWPKS